MSKTILVVDDSATVRQQVSNALKQGGFQVIEAVDGVDGLDKIDSTPGLAMVVCDVNMPRMNGLDMIEKVHAGSRGGSLPIVMLTTEGQPAMMKRAKAAGAKGWIVKPFKANLLVAAAQKLTAA